jgi:hypothetical protein
MCIGCLVAASVVTKKGVSRMCLSLTYADDTLSTESVDIVEVFGNLPV